MPGSPGSGSWGGISPTWVGYVYGAIGALILVGLVGLWVAEISRPVSYLGGMLAASPVGWFYSRTVGLIGIQTSFWEGVLMPSGQGQLKALWTGPLATVGCLAMRACRKSMLCPEAWPMAVCETILDGVSGEDGEEDTRGNGSLGLVTPKKERRSLPAVTPELDFRGTRVMGGAAFAPRPSSFLTLGDGSPGSGGGPAGIYDIATPRTLDFHPGIHPRLQYA